MNYRHAFHAGGFADVFKHIVLTCILESLAKKDKPFCYLDTHAGIGKYDLTSKVAQKTKEYEQGIGKIYEDNTSKPASIEQYLNIISALNPQGQLTYYPGSPRVARALLRPEDRMILTELHPEDAKQLKQEFLHDKQVAVHCADGYQSLKAFLPPLPRRGLVLIDPPFEVEDEFGIIVKQLTMAYKRWQEGIYLIWYPVKYRPQINFFHHQLERSQMKDIWVTELSLYPDDSPLALNGSGLVIINPPWQLEKNLQPVLSWLQRKLDPNNKGTTKLYKLKG